MTNEVKLKLAIEGGQIVSTTIDGVTTRIGALDDAARTAASGSDTLKTALGGLLTVGAAMALVKMADAATTLQTQLRLSSNSAAEASKAYGALFDIAQQGRVSFTELGTTYAAISRAGKELGVSQSRLLDVTKSISQAMTIGGGSAASMQAALMQLGQGLSSGTLRGEELNSIMEQTPRLAKAIADGLGVPIGELRKLGEAGALTSQQVISALEKSGPALAKEMESATLTVGQAFTMLGNSTVKFVGEADKATGASASLAGALKTVSETIDTVGKTINEHETAFAAIAGGLASAAAVAGVAAMAGNLTKVALAVRGIGLALAANPAILVMTGLVMAGGALVAVADDIANSESMLMASRAQIANQITAIDAQTADSASNISAAEKAKAAVLRQTLQDKLNGINQQLALMGTQDKASQQYSAKEDARLAAGTEAYQQRKAAMEAFEKAGTSYLSKDAKNQATLAKEITTAREAMAAGAITADQYAKRINDVRASFAKPAAGAKKLSDEQKLVNAGEKAYGDIMAKDSGYAANFTETILAMVAARDKNNWSAEKYNEVVNAYLALQPGMKALADAEQKEAQAAAKRWGEGYAKQIAEEEKAYRKLADAIDSVDKSINAMLRENNAMQASNELDLSLMGQTAEARAKAIDQQQVLNKYIEEERKARETITDPAVLTSKLDLINTQKLRAVDLAAQKQSIAEWNRTNDRISDGLVSALTKGGHEGAQQVRDLLVQELFSKPFQMVIQALISPVANAVAGAATSMTGSALSSAGGSMLGNAASMASLGASAGSAFGAGAASWFTNGIAGTIDLMTTATGSLLADASFALGAVAAPLAIALAVAGLSGGGETRSGAQYSNKGVLGDVNYTEGPSGGEIASDAARAAFIGAQDSINLILKRVGSSATLAGFNAGLESSENGHGFAGAGGTLSTGATFGDTGDLHRVNAGSKTPEVAMAEYVSELRVSVMQALQAATDIPKGISDKLAGIDLNNISQKAFDELEFNILSVIQLQEGLKELPFENLKTLSFEAADGLLAAADALDNVAKNGAESLGILLNSYYTNFYTETEKTAQLTTNTAKAFTDLGLVMPTVDEGLKAAYRSEIERLGAMDLSVEANAKAYAGALALQGSVSTLATTFDAAADKMAKAMASLQSAADQYNLNAGASEVAIAQSVADRAFAALVAAVPGVANYSEADTAHWLATATAADISASMGDSIDIATAFLSAFNSLTSAMDDAAQTAADAAQTAADAAQTVADSFNAAGKGIYDFVQGLIRSAATTDQLWATYKTDLILAQAGDLSASERITTSAQAYLDKQRAGARTTAEAEMVTARMVSDLSALPAMQSYEQEMVKQLRIIAQNTDQTPTVGTTPTVPGSRTGGFVAGPGYDHGPETLSPMTSGVWNIGDLWNGSLAGLEYSPSVAAAAAAAAAAAETEFEAAMAVAAILTAAGFVGTPAFDKGTNYLPEDMLAQVHKGERIIPAADNTLLMQRLQSPQANNDVLVAEIRALRAEVSELRKSNSAENVAIAGNTKNAARRLETFEADGIAVRNDAAKPFIVEITA